MKYVTVKPEKIHYIFQDIKLKDNFSRIKNNISFLPSQKVFRK